MNSEHQQGCTEMSAIHWCPINKSFLKKKKQFRFYIFWDPTLILNMSVFLITRRRQ